MLENSINESYSALNQSRSALYDREEGPSSSRQVSSRSSVVKNDKDSSYRNKGELKAMASKEIENFE